MWLKPLIPVLFYVNNCQDFRVPRLHCQTIYKCSPEISQFQECTNESQITQCDQQSFLQILLQQRKKKWTLCENHRVISTNNGSAKIVRIKLKKKKKWQEAYVGNLLRVQQLRLDPRSFVWETTPEYDVADMASKP